MKPAPKSSKTSSNLQIGAFAVGVVALSTIFQMYTLRDPSQIQPLAVVALSWVPGLVALACSRYFGNHYRDLAVIQPRRTSVLLAYGVPAACAILTLLLLVIFQVGEVKWPAQNILRLLLVQPLLGVAAALVLSFGEELGWRGYLHSHLMRARIPHPLIVTGLLYSIWHWPNLLFNIQSQTTVVNLILLTVTLTSFSVMLGWLREFSKSVVPCALASAVHSTWNETIGPGFYAPGRFDPYFSGEGGVVLAVLYAAIAIYLYSTRVAASNY